MIAPLYPGYSFSMSTPFLGEIKMISFNYPPKGWALANGQLLAINQNQALFSLYGVTYGGNGQTTFGLPNLQGRAAMHFGKGFTLGQTGGEALHALTVNEIPMHNHSANVSTASGIHAPANNNLPGNLEKFYDPTNTSTGAMANAIISNAGASQGHENRMPFLTLSFIVALTGIYPSRS